MSTIEGIYGVCQTICAEIISALEPIMGFATDVYFPISNDSVYGAQDSTSAFASKPTLSKNFMYSGIYGEGFLSDRTADPFNSDDKIMWLANNKTVPPEDSRVVIKFGDNRHRYRVKEIKVVPGVDKEVVRKLVLKPEA